MTLEIPKTINENIITDESTNVSTIVVDKTIFLKIDESVFILTGDEFLSLFNNFLLDVEGFWNNYN